MFTKVSKTTFPYDLKSLNILITLNERITVAVVDMSIPISIILKMNPMSVPITIAQSNLFHADTVKYLWSKAINFMIISILNTNAKT